MASDMIERADSVRATWKMALDKGYFQDAIIQYTVPEFVQFIAQLIPGVILALLVPILGQWGGTAAGSAIGTLIGPEGTAAGAIIGRAVGALVASLILAWWALEFIKDFVMPQIGLVNDHLGKGISQAWDAGGWGKSAKERLQDAAAKEMAEGVGVLFGLILMGLVMYLSKGPTERLARWRNSFLARTCAGLSGWVETNIGALLERYRNGPTRGGSLLSASTRLPFEQTGEFAAQVIAQVVDRVSRRVLATTLAQLDTILTRFGFRLIAAEPYGPDAGRTGWQLFYQKGYLQARFKTTGEGNARSPRYNIPHISFGFNDGLGTQWRNDMGKFTIDGRFVVKAIMNPAGFNPIDFQGNPQVFVQLPANYDGAVVDAWAALTHFNVDTGFTLDGLADILRRAGARPGTPPAAPPPAPPAAPPRTP